MAKSNPMLKRVDIPTEAKPHNTFTIGITAHQGKGDSPLGSFTSGGCTTRNLGLNGWVTPVTLWVDGERVATQELCLENNNSRDTTMSISLSKGKHRVSVKVHPVGDIYGWNESWKDNLDNVADEVKQTVDVSREASDPSRASSSDRLLMFIEDIAGRIGTSVNMLALGAVAAVGVFLLV